MNVRDATAADVPSLQAIYGHHVLHGFGTFDEVPPDVTAMKAKWQGVVASGLAWLVAEEAGEVAGFAYASIFRPRPGYRYSVEDSVYVREDRRGRGVGAKLLGRLIERCEVGGVRQMIAVIGDSQNTSSIDLHLRAGFEQSGVIKGAGFKLGRWVDIVMMQRALNGGSLTAPPPTAAWTHP